MIRVLLLTLFFLIPINFSHAETIKLANQGTYVGEVSNGKPHGFGTFKL